MNYPKKKPITEEAVQKEILIQDIDSGNIYALMKGQIVRLGAG